MGYGQSILSQVEYRGTIKNYKKCGRMFWNDLQLCPVWDSSGKMCMIVGAQFEIEAPGYEEVRRVKHVFWRLKRKFEVSLLSCRSAESVLDR